MTLSKKQLDWIKDTLGEAAVERVLLLEKAGKSDEDILKSIRHMSGRKDENGVKYKDRVDSEHRPQVAPRPQSIEAQTAIIEDDAARLADKAKRLAMPDRLHNQLLTLLGADKLETVYTNALSTAESLAATAHLPPYKLPQKSLSRQEQSDLEEQQADAMGLPYSVQSALAKILGTTGYSNFIKRLVDSRFWGQPLKPQGV